jgi:uncharacterized protein (TIGR02996 family)
VSLVFDLGFRVMPCGRFLYGSAEGFFGSLRLQPRDWTTRLVLADYLEENSPFRGHRLRAEGIRVACQGDPDRKRIGRDESKWLGVNSIVLWPHLRALASAGAGFVTSRNGRWVTFQVKLPWVDPVTGRRPPAPHPLGRRFLRHRVVMEFRAGLVVKATYDSWPDFYALGPSVAADEPLAAVEVGAWEPDFVDSDGGFSRRHSAGLFGGVLVNVLWCQSNEIGPLVLAGLRPPGLVEVTSAIPGARTWMRDVPHDRHPYHVAQGLRRHVFDVAGELARGMVTNHLLPGFTPAEDPDETTIAATTAAD